MDLNLLGVVKRIAVIAVLPVSTKPFTELQEPPIEAACARDAYVTARERHPGQTVHVARVLTEPCSPGERAHA